MELFVFPNPMIAAGLLAIFLALAIGLQPTAVARQQPPLVDLGYARYQGTADPALNITSFIGVRFAAAPVGKLRFSAPQAPLKVTGVIQANAQPPACPQIANFGLSPDNYLAKRDSVVQSLDKRATISEDCLFLNVHTPTNTAAPLPVVVYIHGGGYLRGSLVLPAVYDGSDLIKTSNYKVVSVVIQYRLGVFGFLAGAKVKKGGALNAGILDQTFALRWVQQHIAKFGGDPAQVTIWGESAGAGSVLQHIIAEDGKLNPPLFRAAMVNSVYLPSQYRYNDRVPEVLYNMVVDQANCASASDSLACLRVLDTTTLSNIGSNVSLSAFYGTCVFVPVVDGTYIRQRPSLALAQGKVNGKALLTVTNTFEGRVFVNLSTAGEVQTTRYTSLLFPEMSTQVSSTAGKIYSAAGVGAPIDEVVALQGESIFICPSYALLWAFRGRAYKGLYAIPPGNHAEDVAYYWPTGRTPRFNDPSFIKAFASSFMSFAVNLDPNKKVDTSSITPAWGKWTPLAKEMLFNRTQEGLPIVQETKADLELMERCLFWANQTSATAQ